MSVKPLASFGDCPELLILLSVFVPKPSGTGGSSLYTFSEVLTSTGITAGSAVLWLLRVSVIVSNPVPELVCPQTCWSLEPLTPPASLSLAILSFVEPSPQFIV